MVMKGELISPYIRSEDHMVDFFTKVMPKGMLLDLDIEIFFFFLIRLALRIFMLHFEGSDKTRKYFPILSLLFMVE